MQTEEQRLTKILTDHPKVYDMLDVARAPALKSAEEMPALKSAVETIRKADPKLTAEQATVKALEQHPELYEVQQ